MKKTVFILILLISCFSCKKETYNDVVNSNTDKTNLFIGKWIISYVDAGFYQKISDQVIFNSDKTLTVISTNYNWTGWWKIAENTFTSDRIYNSYNYSSAGSTTYTIEKIGNNELILMTAKGNNNYRIKFIKN